jgi:6-phosphogluconolactonase
MAIGGTTFDIQVDWWLRLARLPALLHSSDARNSMNLRQTITAVLTLMASAAGLCSCGSSNATHLLYVSTGQGVYGYRVNNKTGIASELPSSPFIVGNTPAGMVIDGSGQHAYLANQSDNTISSLKIDPASGVLSEVLPRTAAGGISPNQLLLDSNGTTLFAANLSPASISAFTAGTKGDLSFVSNTPLASQPTGMAFANGLLFVAEQNLSRIYVFSVSSGVLTAVSGSPLLLTDGIGSVTVDPSAKFLYVTNPSTNTISAFSIQYATGTIAFTPVPGSPFVPNSAAIPTAPVSAVLDASAAHLYVANYGSANISQFSVAADGSLSTLTSTQPISTGTNPSLMTLDPSGTLLFVGNLGSNSVTELSVKSDGTLATNGQSIMVHTVPQALALTK